MVRLCAVMVLAALAVFEAVLPAQAPLAPQAAVDPALFGELTWRNIGPHRASRTRAITGVVQEPHTFYIGVSNGGVWKTTDAGRTWQPIFDREATGSTGALAVAPSDPRVLYLVPARRSSVLTFRSGTASTSPPMPAARGRTCRSCATPSRSARWWSTRSTRVDCSSRPLVIRTGQTPNAAYSGQPMAV